MDLHIALSFSAEPSGAPECCGQRRGEVIFILHRKDYCKNRVQWLRDSLLTHLVD